MDPCKNEEPQVIDFAMLSKCIQAQFPPGEAGRLTREEGIPYKEVKAICIEYQKVLRIDHLWVLASLTKLALNNNMIEKIENLDTLVNLTELNLSFNNISKIENLDALVNLECLSLYQNKITVVENISNLKNLLVLSLGNNLIEDRESVLSLRWFKKLTSVNMAGNPCSQDEEDFRIFVGTFLPQIAYYEYKMVLPEERALGAEQYAYMLRKVEESEVKIIEAEELEKHQAEEMRMNAGSFVEFLSDRFFFDSLFEDDHDGQALRLIGGDVKDFYAEFEEQTIAICYQIYKHGQAQFVIRQEEIESFTNTVDEAKLQNQQESIKHMELFMHEKNDNIFYMMRKSNDAVNNGEITMEEYDEQLVEYSHTFERLIHTTWKELMGLEMTLYVQVEECDQAFERSMIELVNIFIEGAQMLFSQIRTLETTYTDNISEYSGKLITVATTTGESNWNSDIEWFMCDKDLLTNVIGATHDIHMQRIDAREDTLMTKAKDWLEILIHNLQRAEIARNRAKVLEINHFLDIQRRDFREMQTKPIGPELDPDISAALG